MAHEKIDYSTRVTPSNYCCSQCGTTGCKLWRKYQAYSADLLCARCAAQKYDVNISDMDGAGMVTDAHGDRTDKIGSYVPAVPDPANRDYWGYGSVPQEGVDWWERLPNTA